MHKGLSFPLFCQQTISGGLIEESMTPPPAYAITIESGESIFQPPSYKMIFPSTYSYSQDSYGGLPDFSCFSAGIVFLGFLLENCCVISTHWGKNPQFIRKFTFSKPYF